MVSFKHKFTSAKADGGDSTLVRPSNWNDEHNITTTGDGVVLGVPPGAGPGQVQELPMTSVFPAGFVATFAGAAVPAGWLLCNGALVNRADLPALFTAIGTAYNIGGEATTQFRLPDCRGRVIAGLDGGVGRLSTYNINNPNVVGGVGGIDTRQPRVYGNVQTYGQQDGLVLSGTTDGESGDGSIGNGNGPTVVLPFPGHTHAWRFGPFSVGFTANGSIVNNGGNLTDLIPMAQPTIMMNMMIKT